MAGGMHGHSGSAQHIAHMPHIRPHLAHEGALLWAPYNSDTWCQDNQGNWYPCNPPSLSLSPSVGVGWRNENLDMWNHPGKPASVQGYIGQGQNIEGTMVGGLLTTAEDVRNAKLALDPQMVATNRQWESVSLGNTANNPIFSQAAADDSFAWDQFFDTWNTFVITDSSFFGASDDMARLNDFANELAEWQTRLTADTQNSPGGPISPILRATPPAQPPPPENPLTPVVWIAGFVVAGILLVEIFPFLHAAAPRRSRSSYAR